MGLEIHINLDKRCAKCARKGATPCGLCIRCAGKKIIADINRAAELTQQRRNR